MTTRNIATKAAQPASEPVKNPRGTYNIKSQTAIDLQQVVHFLTSLAKMANTSALEREEQSVAQERARVERENGEDFTNRLDALRVSGSDNFNYRIPTPPTRDALAPVTLDLPNVTAAANQSQPAVEYGQPFSHSFTPSANIDLSENTTVQAVCHLQPGHVFQRTTPFAGLDGRLEYRLENVLKSLSHNYCPESLANYFSTVHAAVGIVVTGNHRPRLYLNWEHNISCIKLKQKNNSTDSTSKKILRNNFLRKCREQMRPVKHLVPLKVPLCEAKPPVSICFQIAEAQVTHYALRAKAWENNNFLNIGIELLVVKFVLVLLIDKINKKIKIKSSKNISLNFIENHVYLLINLRMFFEYLARLSISFFCFIYVSQVLNVFFVRFLC